jgi:CheY-like chemotaxis protein
MNVLVCEDNQVALKVIQVALEELNLNTVIAHDGRQALKILDETPDFDLIVTDIHMPFNNGDEILSRIRESSQSTPIIMISSDANEDVIRIAKDAGVNEFIEKPFDPKALQVKVKKLLKM